MLTLILLPGLDGTGEMFTPFVAALNGEFDTRIINYPSNSAFGYSELETFIQAQLPVDSPYVILGESFSGPLAISIAAKAPSQLKAVILCCTFARNPLPVFSRFRSLVHHLPVGWMPTLALAPFLLGNFYTSKLYALLVQCHAQLSTSVIHKRLEEVLTVDVTESLRKIDIPVLYMQALHDHVIPASSAKHILEVRPATKLMTFDAPHLLLQTIPQEAARCVRDFLVYPSVT